MRPWRRSEAKVGVHSAPPLFLSPSVMSCLVPTWKISCPIHKSGPKTPPHLGQAELAVSGQTANYNPGTGKRRNRTRVEDLWGGEGGGMRGSLADEPFP